MSHSAFPSTAFVFRFGHALSFKENTFVHKILTNDLLFDAIFDACTPGSILLLSRTCEIARGAALSYLKRVYNIDRILKPYFPDPLAFRSLQRRTGALIAGSAALQFFLRERYPESDLDVYVRKDVREEVCRWILAQGYAFKPSPSQDPSFELAIKRTHPEILNHYDWIAVDSVFTFVKPDETHPKKELQVQIIVSQDSPMEVILKFHTTVVMNVIAWDSAYSLYPKATLDKRETLFLRHDLISTEEFMDKYRGRGFHIHNNMLSLKTHALFEKFAVRWIGDGRAWVIRLPPVPEPEGAPVPIMSRDPCIGTAWRLTYKWAPRVQFESIHGPRMRYTYIVCDSHIRDAVMQIENLREGEVDVDVGKLVVEQDEEEEDGDDSDDGPVLSDDSDDAPLLTDYEEEDENEDLAEAEDEVGEEEGEEGEADEADEAEAEEEETEEEETEEEEAEEEEEGTEAEVEGTIQKEELNNFRDEVLVQYCIKELAQKGRWRTWRAGLH